MHAWHWSSLGGRPQLTESLAPPSYVLTGNAGVEQIRAAASGLSEDDGALDDEADQGGGSAETPWPEAPRRDAEQDPSGVNGRSIVRADAEERTGRPLGQQHPGAASGSKGAARWGLSGMRVEREAQQLVLQLGCCTSVSSSVCTVGTNSPTVFISCVDCKGPVTRRVRMWL